MAVLCAIEKFDEDKATDSSLCVFVGKPVRNYLEGEVKNARVYNMDAPWLTMKDCTTIAIRFPTLRTVPTKP